MPQRLLLLMIAVAAVGAGVYFWSGGGEPRREVDPLGAGARPAALGGPVDTPGGAELSGVAGRDARAGGRAVAAVDGPGAAAARAAKGAQRADVPDVPTGPFTGRVLDPTGAPVPDASFELRPWSARDDRMPRSALIGRKPWPEGRTGKDGRFSLPHDDRLGKSLAVTVKARGFLDAPFQAVLPDAGASELGDLYLERAVIVQGFVHDERGAPVAGARLRLGARDEDPRAQMMAAFGMGGAEALGETDTNGRFELPHVRPGELTLVAEHEEHHPARWTGATPDAGGVLADLDLELVRAGSITGAVRDFPKGRRGVQVAARKLPDETSATDSAAEGEERGRAAVFGAMFQPAGSETTEVLEDGTFALHGLARVGRYELTVTERQDFVRTVPLSRVVTAESGAIGVLLDYDAGATVRMRLVDDETHAPIEVADVTGNWGGERARVILASDAVTRPTSFPGGVLTLYELRPPTDPGELSLRVTAPGYVERRLPAFAVGARAVVDLGDVELRRSPKLRFHVVDATTGKGISRAQVTVRQPDDVEEPSELWQRGADAAGRRVKDRTGSDGRIALDSIDAAAAVLTVRATGYPTYRDPKFVPRDTEREHRIALVKGGDLLVYAIDPSGAPVEGARARMRRAGAEGEGDAEDTNGDGLARWRALEPGRYEVRAFRRGADPATTPGAKVEWTAVDVMSDRAAEVALEVGGAATLTGVVTLAGAPLGGAQLSLVRRDDGATGRDAARMQRAFGGAGRAGDATDAEGRFTVADVVPGSYDLVIDHRSLAMDALHAVDLEVGENEVEVVLAVATLEGRIADDDGKPIVGARVAVDEVTTDAIDQGGGERRAFRSFMRDDSRDARTDSEGRYRVVGVATREELQVTARADGHVTASSPALRLGAAETRTGVDLELRRAGSVEVTLVSDTPNPVGAFVRAKFVGEGALEDVVEVLRGSKGIVDGLAPGTWELTATDFGGARGQGSAIDTPKRVEVKAGERAKLEFRR